MNRLFCMFIFVVIMLPQAWGATGQYPDPNRQTMWNNMTDGLHTMGQNPQQAKWAKMRLRNARALARINKMNQVANARHKSQIKLWRAEQNN